MEAEKKVINYCGISGGKDSAAVLLWLIHESGVPRESIRATFCDTHNEHELTYRHIVLLSNYLVENHCAPIVTLEPELGFLDLAKKKGRFPSRKARFCTQHLKVIPSRKDVTELIRKGYEVIVHSGVRASESVTRAKLIERGFDDMFGCVVNRPLLKWTLEDVIAYHAKFGVPLNPLYSYGAKRVGCFPCINSGKAEIRMISLKFPERIDEIRIAERQIGKISTFFARKTVPERFRSLEVQTKKGPMKVATIDDVVRWSHTGERAQGHFSDDDSTLICPSGLGMCE